MMENNLIVKFLSSNKIYYTILVVAVLLIFTKGELISKNFTSIILIILLTLVIVSIFLNIKNKT